MTLDPWVSGLIGQVIDGYRIDAFIAPGTFGRVFEVTGIETDSQYAMKILLPNVDAQSVAEFDIEGTLLKKLNKCSEVIDCIESGTATISVDFNGTPLPLPFRYHVLTLGSGALEELVLDPMLRAELPWEERLSHWRGAIKGVHQMHLNKIAHRDLKSSNCLLLVRGGHTEVRLVDLGRSKDFNLLPSLSQDNYLIGRGDLRFAPPEYLWFQGGSTEADFRNADLYGLGSLLVELATGHPMTALAIGSWQDATLEGAQDFKNGYRRDLAVMRPTFHRAIEEITADFVPAIRRDAAVLLRQLCDPVPAERQPKRLSGKRHVPDNGLEWLLRRADILIRQLSVESRRSGHQSPKARRRSAS
jgi:eukaryotic-like serine/threonine-protein kinase